ncbi:MAG: peptidylprolyl isomerase [Sphingomicrobium sp.]
MIKSLFALPFYALALVAAAPTPTPPAGPSSTPPAEVAANLANRLNLQLSNGGTIVVQLRPDVAPNNVYRIQQLASSGFYNGLNFHRVIPGFMAQGGDPLGTGAGGSQLPDLRAEFSTLPHLRGVMAMARSEAQDSANSQFYIMLSAGMALDRRYTVVGRVISGMDVVDRIEVGEPPMNPTKIVRAWIDGPLTAPAPVAASTLAEPAPAEPAPTQ